MTAPRYRTLDGDEVELPLAMDRWVLVPRALARFDPELAWTLDYDDAPEPEDADPRLDFSAGALLVPVERWDERAALEPNLAPCGIAAPFAGAIELPRPVLDSAVAPIPRAEEDESLALGASVAGVLARAAAAALAVLAIGYVVAVAAWLWSLRRDISGADVSTGLLLIGAAMLLAWLAGVSGFLAGVRSLASPPRRDRSGRAAGVCHHLAEHPLAILRLGLVLQLTGFFVLVAIR
jgi:hypothetical protein